MKRVKLLFTAAAALAFAGSASAQLPGAGAAPDPTAVLNGVVPPAPLATGIAPQPALPGGPTIWSKLGISQDQREYCRRKTCRTPAGQLMSRIVSPISTLTGGIVPQYCPTLPSVAELMDPGAIGAASKVKMDRAGAEERVKAVKYLATVDCHYWPEAEETLIAALRADRNECVRYEAAVAFMNGCCCTCKVVMALSICVSCSTQDGHPSEKSARVRAIAAHALDRCLGCVCCAPELPPLIPPKADEKGKETEKKSLEPGKTDKDKEQDKGKDKVYKPGDPEYPKQYYASVNTVPRQQVVAIGRRALAIGMQIGYNYNDAINANDYVAAGLPGAGEGQTSTKPTTLVELMTWRDSGAAIAQSIPAPPTTIVRNAPTQTAVVPAPAPIQSGVPQFTLNDPIPKATPNTNQQMVTTPAPAPAPAFLPAVQPKPVMTAPKPDAINSTAAVLPLNAPIPAPAPAPAPVMKQAPAPVAVPAPAPVAVPTPAPVVSIDTPKPVVPVIDTPKVAPTIAPITVPVPAPVAAPTVAPATTPSSSAAPVSSKSSTLNWTPSFVASVPAPAAVAKAPTVPAVVPTMETLPAPKEAKVAPQPVQQVKSEVVTPIVSTPTVVPTAEMPKKAVVVTPPEVPAPKPVVTAPTVPTPVIPTPVVTAPVVTAPVVNPTPVAVPVPTVPTPVVTVPVTPVTVPDVSSKPQPVTNPVRPATERGAPVLPKVPAVPTAPVVKPQLKLPPEPAPLNGNYTPTGR